MKVTTKELRIQPGKIINLVSKGQEVTITYRGKEIAKLVPIQKEEEFSPQDETIFGMWKDHPFEQSVEEYIRKQRKGRQF